FVSPRIDEMHNIVMLTRPAGVVLAITPTTNPVASVYFKVILALLTRNAVVVAPHPRAKGCCSDAAQTLCEIAEQAGAPKGIIQVLTEPTIPLLQTVMQDPRTDVIVATGGSDVVRAAYSSGNPALGVGPGNVPIFVDSSASISAAADEIVASKAFDNSVLCTNESVLVVEDSVGDKLEKELRRAGAYILTPEHGQLLRSYMFFNGRLNTDVVGKDAVWIAEQAGFRVGPKTKVLVAPIDEVLPDDPMTHEKLSPVLGIHRVTNSDSGIAAARAVVRIGGAGHSASIYSEDPRAVMSFTANVPVLRVSVNVGNSKGSSGLGTHLAPSMTLGTGFVGRSSIGENLEAKHLVNWAKMAYSESDNVSLSNFSGLDPWRAPRDRVPVYPVASNTELSYGQDYSQLTDTVVSAIDKKLPNQTGNEYQLREEIRKLVLEELAQLSKE